MNQSIIISKKNISTPVLILFFLIYSCGTSYGQIDSVQVQYQFSQPMNIDSTQLNFQELEVKIWVNDFDYIGQYLIEIVDRQTQNSLFKKKLSKQYIIDNNLKDVNGWVHISLGLFDPIVQYDLYTIVRNYQLAELPVIQTLIN